MTSSWASVLLALTLSLQLWDGFATYYGLSLGVQEGNPLLQSCMHSWGIGVTLLGAKSAACLLLLVLHAAASLSLSQWGLVVIAIGYFLGSFLPWVVLLVS